MNLSSKMVFSENLKNHRKIRRQLNKRSAFCEFYVVAFRGASYNLEIYAAKQFAQEYYPVDDLCIIGAFPEQGEAMEFIRSLAEFSFAKYGEVKFKEAFDLYGEEAE